MFIMYKTIESLGKNFVIFVLKFFHIDSIGITYRICMKKLEYKNHKVFSYRFYRYPTTVLIRTYMSSKIPIHITNTSLLLRVFASWAQKIKQINCTQMLNRKSTNTFYYCVFLHQKQKKWSRQILPKCLIEIVQIGLF